MSRLLQIALSLIFFFGFLSLAPQVEAYQVWYNNSSGPVVLPSCPLSGDYACYDPGTGACAGSGQVITPDLTLCQLAGKTFSNTCCTSGSGCTAGDSTHINMWDFNYVSGCKITGDPSLGYCSYDYTYQTQTCGATDSCQGSPYLSAGSCNPACNGQTSCRGTDACAVGGTYKTCCYSSGTVDGNCNGGLFSGTCPGGTSTVMCGVSSSTCSSVPGYLCTTQPCGNAACTAIFPPAPVIPDCNTGMVCTGGCSGAPYNTCNANNGKLTDCTYREYTGGGSCNVTSVPSSEAPSCTQFNCDLAAGYVCSSGSCVPSSSSTSCDWSGKAHDLADPNKGWDCQPSACAADACAGVPYGCNPDGTWSPLNPAGECTTACTGCLGGASPTPTPTASPTSPPSNAPCPWCTNSGQCASSLGTFYADPDPGTGGWCSIPGDGSCCAGGPPPGGGSGGGQCFRMSIVYGASGGYGLCNEYNMMFWEPDYPSDCWGTTPPTPEGVSCLADINFASDGGSCPATPIENCFCDTQCGEWANLDMYTYPISPKIGDPYYIIAAESDLGYTNVGLTSNPAITFSSAGYYDKNDITKPPSPIGQTRRHQWLWKVNSVVAGTYKFTSGVNQGTPCEGSPSEPIGTNGNCFRKTVTLNVPAWIQVVGGDVHSNDRINAPGGP